MGRVVGGVKRGGEEIGEGGVVRSAEKPCPSTKNTQRRKQSTN